MQQPCLCGNMENSKVENSNKFSKLEKLGNSLKLKLFNNNSKIFPDKIPPLHSASNSRRNSVILYENVDLHSENECETSNSSDNLFIPKFNPSQKLKSIFSKSKKPEAKHPSKGGDYLEKEAGYFYYISYRSKLDGSISTRKEWRLNSSNTKWIQQ